MVTGGVAERVALSAGGEGTRMWLPLRRERGCGGQHPNRGTCRGRSMGSHGSHQTRRRTAEQGTVWTSMHYNTAPRPGPLTGARQGVWRLPTGHAASAGHRTPDGRARSKTHTRLKPIKAAACRRGAVSAWARRRAGPGARR
jgi:hypothetical protein